jgi:hypothetical protein
VIASGSDLWSNLLRLLFGATGFRRSPYSGMNRMFRRTLSPPVKNTIYPSISKSSQNQHYHVSCQSTAYRSKIVHPKMTTSSEKEAMKSSQHNETALEQNVDESSQSMNYMPDVAGTQPSPWGKGYKKLYMMCGLVYLCSTMNGTALSARFCSFH